MDTLLKDSLHWLFVIGLGAGVVGSALGIGSGVIIVPVLALCFCVSQKTAQGVSLAVIAPMALMGAIRYYLNPETRMNLWAVAVLAVSAVIGANLGYTIASSLPDQALRRIFGIVMILVGVRMLWRTG